MESPGEYIRRERKLRDISLEDVSKSIRVQAKLLKALEADDYDELPHPTFVKGFFRAYAKHLGLDDNDIILRYEDYRKEFYDEIAPENVTSVSTPYSMNSDFPAEKAGVALKKRYVVIPVTSAVVLLVVLYLIFSGSPEVDKLPTGNGAQTVATGNDDVRKGLKAALETGEEPHKAVKVEETEQKKSPLPKPSKIKKEPRKALKPSIRKKPVAEKASPSPVVAVTLPVSGHTLVVVASETTWMRVEIDGKKSREVLLQPGESATWQGEKGFSLLIGNAGGITLSLDGEDLGAPGGVGKTVRVKLPKGVQLAPVVVKKVLPKKSVKEDKKSEPSDKEPVKEATNEVVEGKKKEAPPTDLPVVLTEEAPVVKEAPSKEHEVEQTEGGDSAEATAPAKKSLKPTGAEEAPANETSGEVEAGGSPVLTDTAEEVPAPPEDDSGSLLKPSDPAAADVQPLDTAAPGAPKPPDSDDGFGDLDDF